MQQKEYLENKMLPIKTNSFRKNLLHCKLMLLESKQKEQEASSQQNYVKSNIESFNQQLILKLAFLELCGWLEIALDEIYLSIGKTVAEKELIERHIFSCYGFNPKDFKSSLKYCLGKTKYDKLKNSYDKSISDKTQKSVFLNKLEKLSDIRNEYAHTIYGKSILPSGQPGIIDIQNDFIFLLRILTKLYYDLTAI